MLVAAYAALVAAVPYQRPGNGRQGHPRGPDEDCTKETAVQTTVETTTVVSSSSLAAAITQSSMTTDALSTSSVSDTVSEIVTTASSEETTKTTTKKHHTRRPHHPHRPHHKPHHHPKPPGVPHTTTAAETTTTSDAPQTTSITYAPSSPATTWTQPSATETSWSSKTTTAQQTTSAPAGPAESTFPYPSGSSIITTTDDSGAVGTYSFDFSGPTQTTWTPDSGSIVPTEHVTSYVLTNSDVVTTTTTTEAACTTPSSDYISTVVNMHAEVRANHTANPLAWDDSLACAAQRQADTCIWSHLVYIDGAGYGQNIAGGTEIDGAIDMWYSEAPHFDDKYGLADPGGNFEDYGHFTQMLWASSTAIGCATKDCGEGMGLYTVCNYYGWGKCCR